jgi:phosphopentomutase
MENRQTAVEWLFLQLYEKFKMKGDGKEMNDILDQAKQMEVEKTIRDYNAGYDDAKCNHINDAENYVNELKYLQSKINEIDDEIKDKQNNIVNILINGK